MTNKQKYLLDLIKEIKIKDSTTLKHEANDFTDIEDLKAKEIDGFIEVRDHELFVIDAKKDGRQPSLLPNLQLQIKVNGELLTREQLVFEKDKIDVENKVVAPEYSIEVSKDQLSLFLQVYPELFLKYRLKNKKRSTKFMLEMETVQDDCNVEEACSKIVEELMKKGIRVDINTTAIVQELMNPTYKPILVAEGLPIIPAVDAQLESFVSQDVVEVVEEVDGKVDFKNRLKIPTVEVGQVIAQVHPPKEGKDGYNLYGKVLQPKPPKKIEVRSKPRVKITEDGKIIALQAGRPSITGQTVKYIDVLETYVVDGDVSMKTGNIYFNGDVIVRGNVKDNMSIESTGSIYVHGNVYHAKLTATQHIQIFGTAIKSKIIAGQLSVFYSSIYKLSQEIFSAIQKLMQALKQLENSLNEKEVSFEYSYILITLIESKFKDIPALVKELLTIINEMPKQANISAKFRIIMNALFKLKDIQTVRKIKSENELGSILFSVKELITEMESMIAENSLVQVNSANMSTIKTNGNIIIKKEGLVHSDLFAGGNIVFEQLDAVVRGGKLEALKNIRAGVIGTLLGDPPELYAGELMSLAKVYQASIKFPHYFTLIDEEATNVILKYNPKTETVTRL